MEIQSLSVLMFVVKLLLLPCNFSVKVKFSPFLLVITAKKSNMSKQVFIKVLTLVKYVVTALLGYLVGSY